MYIHIGGDCVVKDSEIVGFFDIDHCSIERKTRLFFAKNEKLGKVVNVAEDLPKSFVVVAGGKEKTVIVSGIATATLKKRTKMQFEIDYADKRI